MENKQRASFTGSLGFILATAGSAIGLGNLWRFPYLAAKHGGLFLLLYLILAVTFGFVLMSCEISIGRKTATGALGAYRRMDRRFGFVGILATVAPFLIFAYYCVIGGWIVRYAITYLSGGGATVMEVGSAQYYADFLENAPLGILLFGVFLGLSALVVFFGVQKGIERASKLIMPCLFLLIIGVAIYSLTLSHSDPDGETRTAIEGLSYYFIPRTEDLTLGGFLSVLLDAVGQLFYSLSVGMGILITFGSYSKKETDLVRAVDSIQIFDTGVALLAGLVIIPSVFVFQGVEGLRQSGPGLLFVSLPEVFDQMGIWGAIIAPVFFLLVFFAALTSAISLLETVVASLMDRFHFSRHKSLLLVCSPAALIGALVTVGYAQPWRFLLPNREYGNLADLLDAWCNNILLPATALLTCILIGWIIKSSYVTDELSIGRADSPFRRRKLFPLMLCYICPVLLTVLLLQAFGVFSFLN